jgi:hypothetical protein
MTQRLQRWAARHAKQNKKFAAKAMDKSQVLATIRSEAKAAGATLANAGKGTLDPNLALDVFRRDGYKCQVPNCTTAKQDVDLDHIGGHPEEIEADPKATEWLKEQAAKGFENTADGLHCLCARHHNLVHNRERDISEGKKPQPLKP